MYIHMGHMRYQDTKPYEDHFWGRNRIDLVRGWVTSVDTDGKAVVVDGQTRIGYDVLLIATGSVPNKFGWPGQDLDGSTGMYSLQDLAAIERRSPHFTHGAIVGGGLIGIELAEMLHARGKRVTFLVREAGYWNHVLPRHESEMVSRVIRAENIDLRLETELKEIQDDGTGCVGAIVTSGGDRVPVGFVGLTAGVRPNLKVLEGTAVKTDRGVLVDRTLRTNVEGVFAAGDCAEIVTPEGHRNLIQAVWYTGRMMGEVVAGNMLGASQDYDGGVWFNSAKFFDLEYQVYGNVPGATAARHGHEKPSLYWEHESGLRSLRLVHDADDVLIGVNCMGIRFRHKVCERWILEKRPVQYAMDHLRDAWFDPEFYRIDYNAVRLGMRERGEA